MDSIIYRIVIIVCIIFCGCEKTTTSTSVTIAGVVRDEVTGLPVEGAFVGLKLYFCIDGGCHSTPMSGATAASGTDGRYQITYVYNKDVPIANGEGKFYFPHYFCTYASKANYIGSSMHSLFDSVYADADIKLYHSCQLKLHVKNEGINKLDGVSVYIDKGYGISHPFGSPQFGINFKGVKLDTIYYLNEKLWGNYSYTYKVVTSNSSVHNPNFIIYSFFLTKPDTINELHISF
jgi:hypothetical protein